MTYLVGDKQAMLCDMMTYAATSAESPLTAEHTCSRQVSYSLGAAAAAVVWVEAGGQAADGGDCWLVLPNYKQSTVNQHHDHTEQSHAKLQTVHSVPASPPH